MTEPIDRPADAPPKDHPLLEAARYSDAEVEDHDLASTVERYGLEIHDLEYIARQRALRVALFQAGRGDELVNSNECRTVEMSDKERGLVEALIPLYLDGIFLGWRARELSTK